MATVQAPVQQPKPQMNIANMIKNFDKNRKDDAFSIPERPMEEFMR